MTARLELLAGRGSAGTMKLPPGVMATGDALGDRLVPEAGQYGDGAEQWPADFRPVATAPC